jgi:hypothetical protein
MDRDEINQRAQHVTELEAHYGRADSRHFGPLSKEIFEETNAVAAAVQHPESRK